MTPLKILSLGAGVQSTTMFLMAEKGDLERPDRAIFADTGWEPPAVYEHLKWLQSVATIPIDVVTAGNIREETIANVREGRFLTLPVFSDDAGKPGMLRRQCTKDYKLLPLQQHARELWAERERERDAQKRLPPGAIEMWIGISLDEVQRMKPSRVKYIANRWPLIERRMSRNMCLAWLRRHGYPRPPRSSCVACPFKSDAEWYEMKDQRPEEWRAGVGVDEAIRTSEKLGTVYVHKSCRPLSDVVFEPETGQAFFEWNGECEGMCGV